MGVGRVMGRRRVRILAAAAVTALALTSCVLTRPAAQGATTGTGENSAFTEAGVAHIKDQLSATIDLRGPLTAADLGATDEAGLVGLEADDPIAVTLIGPAGEFVADAHAIAILDQGGQVTGITITEDHPNPVALASRFEETAGVLGDPQGRAPSLAESIRGGSSDGQRVTLNGADALGFRATVIAVPREGGDNQLTVDILPAS